MVGRADQTWQWTLWGTFEVVHTTPLPWQRGEHQSLSYSPKFPLTGKMEWYQDGAPDYIGDTTSIIMTIENRDQKPWLQTVFSEISAKALSNFPPVNSEQFPTCQFWAISHLSILSNFPPVNSEVLIFKRWLLLFPNFSCSLLLIFNAHTVNWIPGIWTQKIWSFTWSTVYQYSLYRL